MEACITSKKMFLDAAWDHELFNQVFQTTICALSLRSKSIFGYWTILTAYLVSGPLLESALQSGPPPVATDNKRYRKRYYVFCRNAKHLLLFL